MFSAVVVFWGSMKIMIPLALCHSGEIFRAGHRSGGNGNAVVFDAG